MYSIVPLLSQMERSTTRMSCCKYVDDCLVVSEKAESILRDEIGKYWNLKESSIGKPKIYLGGKCREVELDNGTNCWAFGSDKLFNYTVATPEAVIALHGIFNTDRLVVIIVLTNKL